MHTVLTTADFESWLSRLKDSRGKARIIHRIRALERGNPGDMRGVGLGVIELRVHVGPGYRVYAVRRKAALYVLLCGGSKRTQSTDISRAKKLASDLESN